jgi:hypothetical protein
LVQENQLEDKIDKINVNKLDFKTVKVKNCEIEKQLNQFLFYNQASSTVTGKPWPTGKQGAHISVGLKLGLESVKCPN